MRRKGSADADSLRIVDVVASFQLDSLVVVSCVTHHLHVLGNFTLGIALHEHSKSEMSQPACGSLASRAWQVLASIAVDNAAAWYLSCISTSNVEGAAVLNNLNNLSVVRRLRSLQCPKQPACALPFWLQTLSSVLTYAIRLLETLPH